jgi:hypothetical protein
MWDAPTLCLKPSGTVELYMLPQLVTRCRTGKWYPGSIMCANVLPRHIGGFHNVQAATVHVTTTGCCCCCCFLFCCTGANAWAVPARPVMHAQKQAPAGPAQTADSTPTATAHSQRVARPVMRSLVKQQTAASGALTSRATGVWQL